jgi:hypothetical protein
MLEKVPRLDPIREFDDGNQSQDQSVIEYPAPSMRFDFMRKSKESTIFNENNPIESDRYSTS